MVKGRKFDIQTISKKLPKYQEPKIYKKKCNYKFRSLESRMNKSINSRVKLKFMVSKF